MSNLDQTSLDIIARFEYETGIINSQNKAKLQLAIRARLEREVSEAQEKIEELKKACSCAANTLEALGEEDGFTGSQLQIDKLRRFAKEEFE